MNDVLRREDLENLHHQFVLGDSSPGNEQEDVWIRAGKLNVHVRRMDEGVAVDIWGKEGDDAPLATTHANFLDA